MFFKCAISKLFKKAAYDNRGTSGIMIAIAIAALVFIALSVYTVCYVFFQETEQDLAINNDLNGNREEEQQNDIVSPETEGDEDPVIGEMQVFAEPGYGVRIQYPQRWSYELFTFGPNDNMKGVHFSGPFLDGNLIISLAVYPEGAFDRLYLFDMSDSDYAQELDRIFSHRGMTTERLEYETHRYWADIHEEYLDYPTVARYGCDTEDNCLLIYAVQREKHIYEFEVRTPPEWMHTEEMSTLLGEMIFSSMVFIPYN